MGRTLLKIRKIRANNIAKARPIIKIEVAILRSSTGRFNPFWFPTRIMAVTLRPVAIIKVIEERLRAIWLAACGFFPKYRLTKWLL